MPASLSIFQECSAQSHGIPESRTHLVMSQGVTRSLESRSRGENLADGCRLHADEPPLTLEGDSYSTEYVLGRPCSSTPGNCVRQQLLRNWDTQQTQASAVCQTLPAAASVQQLAAENATHLRMWVSFALWRAPHESPRPLR